MAKRVEVDVPKVFRLWYTDMSNDQLCEALGVSRGYLWKIKRSLALPHRPKSCNARGGMSKDWCPTPEEIKKRAAEVRATWPDGEAEKRFVGPKRRRCEIRNYVFDGRVTAFLSAPT